MKKNIIFVLLFSVVIFSCTENENKESEESEKTQEEIDEKYEAGKKLFVNQCSACHAINTKLVGPPLKGITKKRDRKWINSFIRNSQALIASGDEEAKAIYEEYNGTAMTSFDFSDEEIDNILYYIENTD